MKRALSALGVMLVLAGCSSGKASTSASTSSTSTTTSHRVTNATTTTVGVAAFNAWVSRFRTDVNALTGTIRALPHDTKAQSETDCASGHGQVATVRADLAGPDLLRVSQQKGSMRSVTLDALDRLDAGFGFCAGGDATSAAVYLQAGIKLLNRTIDAINAARK